MILGRTAHQRCCTPYDMHYGLLRQLCVCCCELLHCTMARLDDEYQDLEEVIIINYDIAYPIGQ